MGKLRVKNTEIFYREKKGEHPLILFIHGAGGNGRMWWSAVNEIKMDVRKIALDLPEHGNSRGAAKRSIDEYADIIEEFVAQIGEPPTVVAGHSMGGAISITIGLRNPDWIKGLVLVATGAKLKVADFVFTAIASFSPETAKMFSDMLISEGEGRELVKESFEQIKKEVIEGDFVACDRFNVMDEIHHIEIPTLIMCGENDALTPPKYSIYLHDKIKNSRLIIVEGAGHMLPVEKPKIIAKEIEDFLRSIQR